MDKESAIQVMLAQPAIIKRPLLDTGNIRLLGFSEAAYQTLLTQEI